MSLRFFCLHKIVIHHPKIVHKKSTLLKFVTHASLTTYQKWLCHKPFNKFLFVKQSSPAQTDSLSRTKCFFASWTKLRASSASVK